MGSEKLEAMRVWSVLVAGFFGSFATPGAGATFDRVDASGGAPTLIFVQGDLSVGDQKAFIDKVLGLEDAVVVLSSDGGSIQAALAIGKAIRLKGFTTLMPDAHRCVSACALIWLGGQTRYMAATAEIGFHAAYEMNNGASIERGAPNAAIGGYLAGLGYSEDAILFVTSAPPESMSWLTFETADELGIAVRRWETALSDPSESPTDTAEPQPSTIFQEPDGEPQRLTSPPPSMEAEIVARALTAALAKHSGSQITYASAESDGGKVVVRGLKVSLGSDEITFAEAVVEAPTESTAGIFESPRVTFTDGTISGGSTGSIALVTLTAVTVLDPAKAKSDRLWESILFHTAEATNLWARRVAEPGKITVARIYIETGNVADNVAQDSSGVVENIVLPPELFTDSTLNLGTLGYEQLVLDVSWDGFFDVAAQTLSVHDFTISVENAGDLSISGSLGKVVLSDPDALQKIELRRITLRYAENSFAERILDYLTGQQTGQSSLWPLPACRPPCSRADYVQQLLTETAFVLEGLNKQGLENGPIIHELGTFFHDLHSLTISIEPNPPISGEEFLRLGAALPQPLFERLRVSVLATSDDDLVDTDIPLGDLGRMSGIGYSRCKEQCMLRAECLALTFNRVCWLKASVGERKPFAGATSWVKPQN